MVGIVFIPIGLASLFASERVYNPFLFFISHQIIVYVSNGIDKEKLHFVLHAGCRNCAPL
jgi:hypothetical protein